MRTQAQVSAQQQASSEDARFALEASLEEAWVQVASLREAAAGTAAAAAASSEEDASLHATAAATLKGVEATCATLTADLRDARCALAESSADRVALQQHRDRSRAELSSLQTAAEAYKTDLATTNKDMNAATQGFAEERTELTIALEAVQAQYKTLENGTSDQATALLSAESRLAATAAKVGAYTHTPFYNRLYYPRLPIIITPTPKIHTLTPLTAHTHPHTHTSLKNSPRLVVKSWSRGT